MQLRAWLSLDTLSLDAEVLRFHVREGLSEVTDIDAEFVCDTADLDLQSLIWKATALRLEDADGQPTRYFHGVVEEAEYLYARGERSIYRVRLRPRVHGLAYRVRSRIFQDLDAVAVVKRVLADGGVPEDETAWSLTARYSPRELCVQYRESELNFISRLLEEEGIFYWFEHEAGRHVMHFGDDRASHRPLDTDDILAFSRVEHGDREHVTDVVFRAQTTFGSAWARDWNWQIPDRTVDGQSRNAQLTALERYDHPAGATSMPGATRRARDVLQSYVAADHILEGRSNCVRMAPGRTFDLTDCVPEYLARAWLLHSLDHQFEEHGHDERGRTLRRYRATFRAAPDNVEFRPMKRTPRPRVAGVESAVVTGPPGEEIHVDPWGRVKVHFYWDREGATDDRASCWIRTQQQNTSGAMIIPRIGWEVSVGFIHGDPDRPILLQKLYNQETLPPYEQPAHSTQTALQSSTSPGGGTTNEIRLQDGNGGMEFFVHASRNLNLVAEHDVGEHVAADATEQVGQSLQTRVGSNETVSIGANQSVSVTGTCGENVGGARATTVGGNDDWGIKPGFAITTGGARNESIHGLMNVLANDVAQRYNADYSLSVGAALCVTSARAIVEACKGARTETVGAAHLIMAAKACSESVGASKTLLSGAILIKTGTDIGTQAKGAVTFNVAGAWAETCGDGFNLNAQAIVVTAPAGVEMKGGGSVFKARGGKIEYTAGKLTVKATSLLQLKGRINYKP